MDFNKALNIFVENKESEKEKPENTSSLQQNLIDFLSNNQNPSDEEFHKWAESNNFNVHEAESAAYKLAASMARFLKNGLANKKGISENDVDPKELEMGIKVEYEHTPDLEVSKRIALDHLAEIDDYYSKLTKMEGENIQEAKKATINYNTNESSGNYYTITVQTNTEEDFDNLVAFLKKNGEYEEYHVANMPDEDEGYADDISVSKDDAITKGEFMKTMRKDIAKWRKTK